MPYERRTYRTRASAAGLVPFAVRMGESNLMVCAPRDLTGLAREALSAVRRELHVYRRVHPAFFEALEPVDVDRDAPPVARQMANAARACCVGPMAAVAGAIAARVGMRLLEECDDVIVENGGDVFLKSAAPRTVGIFAGRSALSGKIAVAVPGSAEPVGVACSSATVGPSMSFGSADAAVVVARDAALADAAATGLGNRVRSRGDFERALGWVVALDGVRGGVLILGEELGAQGEIELAAAEAT